MNEWEMNIMLIYIWILRRKKKFIFLNNILFYSREKYRKALHLVDIIREYTVLRKFLYLLSWSLHFYSHSHHSKNQYEAFFKFKIKKWYWFEGRYWEILLVLFRGFGNLRIVNECLNLEKIKVLRIKWLILVT